jgi:Flp pilus assembly pilin Flp
MPDPRARRRCTPSTWKLIEASQGATSIEYALLVGVIGIGLLGGLTLTRQAMQDSYSCIASDMQGAYGGGCGTGHAVIGGSLTPAAAKAQTTLPLGSQILLGGVFVDREGGAGYTAGVEPPVSGDSVWQVSLTNSGTGRSASVAAAPISGVFEIALGILAAIGPGAPDFTLPTGMKAVVYLVPDGDGVPRPYYAAKPA